MSIKSTYIASQIPHILATNSMLAELSAKISKEIDEEILKSMGIIVEDELKKMDDEFEKNKLVILAIESANKIINKRSF